MIQEMLEVGSIPITLLKSYEIEAFVMGHHVYKERWTPTIGEHFDAFMEPNNSMDKYAVARRSKSLDISLLGNPVNLQRQFSIF